MIAEGHLLARANIANTDDLAAPSLQRRMALSKAPLCILHQKIELFLAIADIILIKAIIEIIACILSTNIERSVNATILTIFLA